MKNKIFLIFGLFVLFLNFSFANSNEEFVFKSDNIEFKEDGNFILGNGNVKVTSGNNLVIYADKSRYNKINNKLFLNDNVIIIDKKNEIKIEGDEFLYDKKLELIVSEKKIKIKIRKDYEINSSKIKYFVIKDILSSNGRTVINDNFNNQAKTGNFIYNNKSKILKSFNLNIIDSNKNIYETENSIMDLNTKKIAAKNPIIYFSEGNGFGKHSRLKGNSIITDNNLTEIKKGIFTTCKPNDDCPPWTMQSEKIIHDKEKKVVNYKNAWLKLYDVPVFYFPKFFHPDPTVKRQSGFLMPSIASSSISGNSINIPYFNAISENKDMTLSPRIFFNNDILIQNEYRQVEKNVDHITDFSLKKLDKGTKSHFFSNSKINIESEKFAQSKIEFNIEKTSNDTYLKADNIKSEVTDNQNLLNTFINYEANNEDLELTFEVGAYEDLTKESSSDKFQYIMPNFSISKLISTELDLNGNLFYEGSGSRQQRDTNITENYFINDLKYQSDNFFSKKGFINKINLNFKNTSKKGRNSDVYSDDFDSDNFILIDYLISLPLIKEKNDFISSFTPKILTMYSPFDSENISNEDRQLNITNIFSSNRLSQNDSLEGGQSLTLGFDYELQTTENKKIFTSNLGQVFRDKNDNKLPITSSMTNKSSDIVGQIGIYPNDNINFNYNFSADNSLDTMNFNHTTAGIKINNFITSFEFLEENSFIGSDSYFSRNIAYNFNESNSIKLNTRRNRKRDLTEFYNLIYEYKNDCLVAAVEYNKNYYDDRDIKPNEEVFFSLTITPFTSVDSPQF